MKSYLKVEEWKDYFLSGVDDEHKTKAKATVFLIEKFANNNKVERGVPQIINHDKSVFFVVTDESDRKFGCGYSLTA